MGCNDYYLGRVAIALSAKADAINMHKTWLVRIFLNNCFVLQKLRFRGLVGLPGTTKHHGRMQLGVEAAQN